MYILPILFLILSQILTSHSTQLKIQEAEQIQNLNFLVPCVNIKES